MRTKYKPWAKPFLDEHQEVQVSPDSFSNLENIYLEVGSGKGLFLLEMAKKNPDKNFVGIEKNVTCAGFTAKKLVENDINNAKLIFGDGEKILNEYKDKSINVIYLNFSDPWPKVRHHKRRLTSERFCALYLRILKDDGVIIQKTDNEELFDYSLELFSNNGFLVYEIERNYQLDNEDIMTEYEKDFRESGLPIYRMKVKKK